jgi:hypothetical protein
MKTNLTFFTMTLALSGSLLAVEAQAAAGVARNAYSEGSRGSPNVAAVPNSRQIKSNASMAKPAGTKTADHNLADRKAKAGPLDNSRSLVTATKVSTVGEKNLTCKLKAEKTPAPDLCKICGGFDCNKGLKIECFPGKVCWRCGDLDCGRREYWENGCCAGWRPDAICCQPWYGTRHTILCGEYHLFDDPSCDLAVPDIAPIPLSAVKVVRIVIRAETQTTLGFTINGQAYSLEPGKTQELALTGNMTIEFDRKP